MNKRRVGLILISIFICVIIYFQQIPVKLKSTINEEYISGNYNLKARVVEWQKDTRSSKDFKPINEQKEAARILNYILNHDVIRTRREYFITRSNKKVYLEFRDNDAKMYMDALVIGDEFIVLSLYEEQKRKEKTYVIKDEFDIEYLIKLLKPE